MRKFYIIVFKICPLLAFIYSMITSFVTIYISNQISFIYVFLCIQLQLNWYTACKIAKNVSTLKTENLNTRSTVLNINQGASSFVSSEKDRKFWYCEKCQQYTRRVTIHCPLCQKCYHYRDHHCFFMGTCVLRQNMGNFILLCFYSSLSCLYSLSILGPYLYMHLNHFIKPESSIFNISLSFCFPIALIRFLFSNEESCLLLVTLFDALVATFCIGICYGSWKLTACLTGTQIYSFNIKKKDKFKKIFGYYGPVNILFPFDCFVNYKYYNNCELKDV